MTAPAIAPAASSRVPAAFETVVGLDEVDVAWTVGEGVEAVVVAPPVAPPPTTLPILLTAGVVAAPGDVVASEAPELEAAAA